MSANLATVQMNSKALERSITYYVILPDANEVGKGPYSVLLQLHGRYDDGTSWIYKSRLLEYVKDLPLLVVLPSGENGLWANLNSRDRYEDMLVQDIYNHVQTMFNVRKDEKWAIGGLSMGGYGALRLGIRHPDKFSSIYAHSSVIPNQTTLEKQWRESMYIDPKNLTDLNCYHWAEQAAKLGKNLPRLSFDCGVDDALLQDNRDFHAYLEKLGLPHRYVEFPGEHTWKYWDEHVQEAIPQHLEVLNLAVPSKNV